MVHLQLFQRKAARGQCKHGVTGGAGARRNACACVPRGLPDPKAMPTGSTGQHGATRREGQTLGAPFAAGNRSHPPGSRGRYRVRLYTSDTTAEIVVKVGKLTIEGMRRPGRRWRGPFPSKRTRPFARVRAGTGVATDMSRRRPSPDPSRACARAPACTLPSRLPIHPDPSRACARAPRGCIYVAA
jgi:hypothetical protein